MDKDLYDLKSDISKLGGFCATSPEFKQLTKALADALEQLGRNAAKFIKDSGK